MGSLRLDTPRKNRRILVIESDRNAREGILATLKRAGYPVVDAANGDQAAIMLDLDRNSSSVAAILCDIRTPKIKGVEAATYLRVRYPLIPVIITTTYPDIEWAIALMKQGAADYLVKPVAREDVLTVVRYAVDRFLTLTRGLMPSR